MAGGQCFQVNQMKKVAPCCPSKKKTLPCAAPAVHRCWDLGRKRFYGENLNPSMGISPPNEAIAVTAFQGGRCGDILTGGLPTVAPMWLPIAPYGCGHAFWVRGDTRGPKKASAEEGCHTQLERAGASEGSSSLSRTAGMLLPDAA